MFVVRCVDCRGRARAEPVATVRLWDAVAVVVRCACVRCLYRIVLVVRVYASNSRGGVGNTICSMMGERMGTNEKE